MNDLVSTIVPVLVGAAAAGLFQYARVPTLTRRIDRHIKMRPEVPAAQRDAFDELLAAEVAGLIARDRRWLNPRAVVARGVRLATAILVFVVGGGGFLYSRLQPLEERLSSGAGEWAGIAAAAILFVGSTVAARLDGVTGWRSFFHVESITKPPPVT